MSFIIRQAQGRDLATLRQLDADWSRAFISYPAGFDKHSKEIVSILAEVPESGQVIGFGCVSLRTVLFRPGEFAKVGLIHTMRVDPNHRRAGLAVLIVDELHKAAVERGASFAYATTGPNNQASIGLFTRKCGYRNVLECPTPVINVAHMRQLMPRPERLTEKFRFEVTDYPASERTLRNRWSGTFLFPREDRPVNCCVYAATELSSGVSLSVAVANVPHVWKFLRFSWQAKLKDAFWRLLNWLMPSRFECPIQIGRPWQMRVTLPFWIEGGSVSDPAHFLQLAEALVANIVHDESRQSTTDLLVTYCHPLYSGLSSEFSAVLYNSKLISPHYMRSSGLVLMAKSLKSDASEAEQMENYALNQPFWFMDGKEL